VPIIKIRLQCLDIECAHVDNRQASPRADPPTLLLSLRHLGVKGTTECVPGSVGSAHAVECASVGHPSVSRDSLIFMSLTPKSEASMMPEMRTTQTPDEELAGSNNSYRPGQGHRGPTPPRAEHDFPFLRVQAGHRFRQARAARRISWRQRLSRKKSMILPDANVLGSRPQR